MQLPRNSEAERELIGALLFQPEKIGPDLLPLLQPEDFFEPHHARIWESAQEIAQSDRVADLVSICDQLTATARMRHLAAYGNESYLAELANRAVLTSGEVARQWVDLVLDASNRRKTLLLMGRWAQSAETGDRASSEVLDGLLADLQNVRNRTLRGKAVKMRVLLHEEIGILETRYNNKDKSAVTGIPWGLAELDGITTGMQPGQLAIIAGRPGSGKTSLVVGGSLHGASLGFPGLFFSIEMSNQAIMERALSIDSGVDNQHMRTGFLSNTDWYRLTASSGRLADLPLHFDVSSSPTLAEIGTKTREWRRDKTIFPDNRMGFVIVDYLQLVHPNHRGQNREREIAEISTGLKALAKDTDLAMIAVASLSRECEKRTDKRPQMSDLRDSGQIESDADLIVFVYRDEMYDKESKDRGIAELIVSKNRSGPTGTRRVRFRAESTRFTDE